VAPEVQRQYVMASRERGRQVIPPVGIRSASVQQHELRIARPPAVQDVELYTIEERVGEAL